MSIVMYLGGIVNRVNRVLCFWCGGIIGLEMLKRERGRFLVCECIGGIGCGM